MRVFRWMLVLDRRSTCPGAEEPDTRVFIWLKTQCGPCGSHSGPAFCCCHQLHSCKGAHTTKQPGRWTPCGD